MGTGDWGLGTGDWGLGTGDWGLGTGGRSFSPTSRLPDSNKIQSRRTVQSPLPGRCRPRARPATNSVPQPSPVSARARPETPQCPVTPLAVRWERFPSPPLGTVRTLYTFTLWLSRGPFRGPSGEGAGGFPRRRSGPAACHAGPLTGADIAPGLPCATTRGAQGAGTEFVEPTVPLRSSRTDKGRYLGSCRSAAIPDAWWEGQGLSLRKRCQQGRFRFGSGRAAAAQVFGGGLGPPPDQLLPLSHRVGEGAGG